MANDQIVERIRTKLLKEKPQEHYDVWEIRGEDPNPDMGGHHHMPRLMILRSTYEEAVEIALNLKNFIGWGAGGDIRPVIIMTINDVKNIPQLEKRKKELEAELNIINKKLNKF